MNITYFLIGVLIGLAIMAGVFAYLFRGFGRKP
jgi:hypothetical protein